MKRLIYFLLAATVLISSTFSFSSHSSKKNTHNTKFDKKEVLNEFSESIKAFGQNKPGETLFRTAQSQTPPDSVIVTLEENKSEKHEYTYNEDGLLTEERISFLTDNLIDSVYVLTFEYDENGNETLKLTSVAGTLGLINLERVESEYDANGNRTMRLWQNWSDNNWVNSRRNTREYNAEGKRTISLNEDWDGTQWEPSARYTNEYDTNGNLINDIIEFDNNGMLENWRRSGYTYDSNNNRLTWSNFWWTDGAWDETYRYMYEYDSEHRIISSNYLSTTGSDSLEVKNVTLYSYFPDELKEASVTFDYVDGDLVPSERSSSDLNSNGDIVYNLTEEFNVDNLTWGNKFQSIHTYNNDGKPTERIFQVWADSMWINAQRSLFEYDLAGNITYQSFQGWLEGEWVPITTSITIEISDELTFFFWGGEVFLYYGNPVTDVNEIDQLPTQFSLEQNYPNPFNPATIIKFTVPSIETRHGVSVQLRVFDAIGREVTTLVNEQLQPGVYEVDFNAAALSSGVYFYSIQAGSFVKTKKMILLR